MGRGRTEIKKIENQTQRQSTFYKRRDGLFKKARELSILCDVDLLLLLFSPSGRLYQYHSPSVPSSKNIIERYEVATQTKISKDDRERNAEIENIEKLCQLMERELRFMKVEEGFEYSFSALGALEHNLERAIDKVRVEKNRKIEVEINQLEEMVRNRQQEKFEICDKLGRVQALNGLNAGYQAHFSSGLDLKLGFN